MSASRRVSGEFKCDKRDEKFIDNRLENVLILVESCAVLCKHKVMRAFNSQSVFVEDSSSKWLRRKFEEQFTRLFLWNRNPHCDREMFGWRKEKDSNIIQLREERNLVETTLLSSCNSQSQRTKEQMGKILCLLWFEFQLSLRRCFSSPDFQRQKKLCN
jgi:hypothetical protein